MGNGEWLYSELHDRYDDSTAFDEKDPPASALEQKRPDASLHLEGLLRKITIHGRGESP